MHVVIAFPGLGFIENSSHPFEQGDFLFTRDIEKAKLFDSRLFAEAYLVMYSEFCENRPFTFNVITDEIIDYYRKKNAK